MGRALRTETGAPHGGAIRPRAIVITLAFAIAIAASIVAPGPAAGARPSARHFAADDVRRAILVRLAPGVTATGASALWELAGVQPQGGRSRLGVQVVLAPSASTRSVARDRLAGDPRVVYAEVDRVVRAAEDVAATVTPNDPFISNEWWLTAVNVAPAWEYVGLREPVVAAVLDTGAALDHPDLASVLVPGFNLVEPDRPPEDDSVRGHGTHVAGILAAATDNGIGMAGVGWGTRVMPVKVLDADGVGDDAAVAEGLAWAADHGARVVNMSLYGEEAVCSRTLTEAVKYASAKGVVLVAASGNTDGPVGCPASLPQVIAVGSVDEGLVRAPSSNSGSQLRLVAPGVRITSTVPPAVNPSGYAVLSGTSMATPAVSAAAALVRTFAPALSAARVADVLTGTARDLGAAGRDTRYGHGIVDVGAAVAASAELVSGTPAAASPSVGMRDAAGTPAASVLAFTAAVPVAATVRVAREDGSAVRDLFAGDVPQGPASFAWDGLDGEGRAVPDGWYAFRAEIAGPAGRSTTLTVPVGVSSSLEGVALKPATFSPDGDGRYESTAASWILRSPASVLVRVLDASGRVVRTLESGERPAGPDSALWDGRVAAGGAARLAPAGRYMIAVAATTAFGTFEVRRAVTLDVRGVVATSLQSGTVYPVRDGYRDSVALRFRLPARATATVLLYRPGATAPFRSLAAGTLPAGAASVAWDGRDATGRALAAGTYRFRVQTRDPAGIVRLSAAGAVIVSGRRIVRATASETRPAKAFADQSGVSDPDLADIAPSPIFADGARLVVNAPGGIRASASVLYGFGLPSAATASSLTITLRYARQGPTVPLLQVWVADRYVAPVRLERESGTATITVPPATLARALAAPSSLGLVVEVRLAGTGTVDLASVVVRYAYGVLR